MSAERNNATTQTAPGDKSRWPLVASPHVGYLSLAQAAHYLGGISTATVRRWIKYRALPHYYVPGRGGRRGKLFFREGEIGRWMRRHKNALVEKDSEKVLDVAGAGV